MSENKKMETEKLSSPIELAQEQLESFVLNPGLVELAGLFGVEDLPEASEDKLAVLQDVAIQHWDFRKGAERQAVNWNDELLDQEGTIQWNTVFEAADKLGLVHDSEPVNKHPDYLVILGGANKAPFDRLRYGLSVIEDFDQIVYLGSSREVNDTEREKAKDYAPDAKTEFDLGSGAFETLLGAKLTDERTIVRNGDTWGMRFYEFEVNGKTKTGFVLSTPQTIGEKRATTYDNYKFLVGMAELDKNSDKTVVAVTTGFYTKGQHLPAVEELTLPYGVQVETVGHSAEYSGVVRKPSQLLQETKAAIDAAVRLEQAITQSK
ncbi:MAG TPA: hypothetical protein VMV24_00895 [Candidatus Dormibacteraeota bacterium]|nr:hypothetical protein [Candidatus Dormibacteraeota bacterium]